MNGPPSVPANSDAEPVHVTELVLDHASGRGVGVPWRSPGHWPDPFPDPTLGHCANDGRLDRHTLQDAADTAPGGLDPRRGQRRNALHGGSRVAVDVDADNARYPSCSHVE